jgi:hypothetical protein
MTATWEVTDYEPGHRYELQGVDGPVRPIVTMTLVPHEDGTQTQVDIEIDFATSGIGRLFGAMARRSARHNVVTDGQHLKQRLEVADRPAQNLAHNGTPQRCGACWPRPPGNG